MTDTSTIVAQPLGTEILVTETLPTAEPKARKDQIYEYIKDRKHRKVGVMLACFDYDNNSVRVGWSLVNRSRKLEHKDIFTRERALSIAFGRATTLPVAAAPLPKSILEQLIRFLGRAERYFQADIDNAFTAKVNAEFTSSIRHIIAKRLRQISEGGPMHPDDAVLSSMIHYTYSLDTPAEEAVAKGDYSFEGTDAPVPCACGGECAKPKGTKSADYPCYAKISEDALTIEEK